MIRPMPFAPGGRSARVFLLGGSSRSEYEVLDFQNGVLRLAPTIAGLVLPAGVSNPADRLRAWGEMYPVDGMDIGDVIGGT